MYFSFKIKQNNILNRMEQYKNALYRQESIILIYINIYLIYYMKVVLQVSSAVNAIDRHRKRHR